MHNVRHRRIIFKLAKFYAHHGSCRLIQPNSSEVSIIIVILAVKAKFSTTANSKKLSTSKCDTDGQPEIAIWPSLSKYLYLRKYDSGVAS